ncbi:NAD(P)H-hydrate dehydratase [Parvularcula lutaonensis]|uniref:Bifunctional NAD(P)H-hydrate repair enzyme n=1 Tax=Parvularcula lutaonensis TaxID=491923 RepID=A0ABV7MAK3_9PROT|nr:NAD(P)H-hydrate dehydratase [Parvularcula lutaonensis]GGY44744.1 bifunctional NAD(P)H-hydrate repair enzyme [Parvularcula lutaonensis]
MAFDAEATKRCSLMTPDAMAEADRRTIAAGTPETTLIDRAARASLRVLRSEFTRRPVTILCGPGNNGADGLRLGEMLVDAGWPIEVICLGEPPSAERHRGLDGRLRPTGTFAPGPGALVVDALFGAGLSRPVEGEARALIEKLEFAGASVLSIDLPSGIDGATGEVLGIAPQADVTVTFHRLKPGHLLGEGARRCGKVFCADIGLQYREGDASALHNAPELWRHLLANGARETHKYERGHTVVVGGPGFMGSASRLSAYGASVSGAGAVTYLAPLSSAEFAGTVFDAVMVRPMTGPEALEELAEGKASSIVIGPGMGHGALSRDCLHTALASGLPCVVDADALTLYEDEPSKLFSALHEGCVLTPHEGEFARLFKGVEGDKLSRAKAAAARCGATVLLKGSTTVIAGDGLPVINTNGSRSLATAGSGDVLAGLIGGILAQSVAPREAAAAGAWIHAEAARSAGPSLNADRLPRRIAGVIDRLVS